MDIDVSETKSFMGKHLSLTVGNVINCLNKEQSRKSTLLQSVRPAKRVPVAMVILEMLVCKGGLGTYTAQHRK